MSEPGEAYREMLRESERSRSKRKSAKKLEEDRERELTLMIQGEQHRLRSEFYARSAGR